MHGAHRTRVVGASPQQSYHPGGAYSRRVTFDGGDQIDLKDPLCALPHLVWAEIGERTAKHTLSLTYTPE